MVISGKFKQSLGSVAGRLGSAAGEGLSSGFTSAFPKELERARLAKGLNEFEKESEGLSPLQQYTRLAAIPGITPQMIQALPEVLKQQNFAKALDGKNGNEKIEFPMQGSIDKNGKPFTGLTTRGGTEAFQQGYIPPTQPEIYQEAGRRFKENPQFYKNDPQSAIAEVNEEVAINKDRLASFQSQLQGQRDLQNNIKNALQTQMSSLGVQIPGNVLTDLQEKAINSTLPKSEGGEGLTEDEAKVKYGKEADKISREYADIKSWGKGLNWVTSPSALKRSVESTREDFKKRGDLRNFADSLIGMNGLSPSKAYYLAYPPSENQNVKKFFKDLKPVEAISFREGYAKPADTTSETLKIAPKLAEAMGTEGSPLAIAEELFTKGYDGQVFLDYLNKLKKDQKLTQQQADELNKPISGFLPNLNDIWLFKFLGQDSIVE